MTKMFNDSKRAVARGIEPHSKMCGVITCEHETSVAIVLVKNDMGRNLSGAFSRFGKVNNVGELILNSHFTFVEWVTRCAECYQRDVEAHNARTERREQEASKKANHNDKY